MSVMAQPARDPAWLVTQALNAHGGERRFAELIAELTKYGVNDDAARDLIWRLLSEGRIIFTTDREWIQLVPDDLGQKAAG